MVRTRVLSAAAVSLALLSGAPRLAAATSTPATTWTVVPSPNPSEQASYLTSLAPISATDMWAAGAWYRPSSTPGTLTQHWNGSAWTVVPSPNATAGYNELYGVDAVSPTDVWAVGYHNIATYGSEKTMTLHWDGVRWSIVPSRNLGPNANMLRAVSAVAANDVWAVGLGASTSTKVGRPLIQHWEGTRWRLSRTPNLGGGFGILNGVAALAANDVWAVGTHDDATLIEHWDGTAWEVVRSPNGTRGESELYAVSANGPDDVWAVGDSYDNRGSDTLVLHWDGSAWSVVPSMDGPQPNTSLYGVAAVGPDDVWAVGSAYDPIAVSYQTFTEHWDGSGWTIVASPNPGPLYNVLSGAAGLPGGEVWAAGEAYTDPLTLRALTG
jgi:hypothetical protein